MPTGILCCAFGKDTYGNLPWLVVLAVVEMGCASSTGAGIFLVDLNTGYTVQAKSQRFSCYQMTKYDRWQKVLKKVRMLLFFKICFQFAD